MASPAFLDELLHRTGPLQVVLLLLLSASLLAAAFEIGRNGSGRGIGLRDCRPCHEIPSALLPRQRSESVDARSDR